MDDLVRWLGQQLDADAARATTAAEELGPDWYYDDGFVLARREDDMVATGSQGFLERKYGAHIAEHDPARVLREIDAKRRMLDLHREVEDPQEMQDYCATCEVTGDYPYYPCMTLRLLALPYSDRPGFKESWRP